MYCMYLFDIYTYCLDDEYNIGQKCRICGLLSPKDLKLFDECY